MMLLVCVVMVAADEADVFDELILAFVEYPVGRPRNKEAVSVIVTNVSVIDNFFVAISLLISLCTWAKEYLLAASERGKEIPRQQ